jgi:DNA-binding NarL/FixJ family response regulator
MVGSGAEIRSEGWSRPHLFHIGSLDTTLGPPTWKSILAESVDFMKLRIAVADDNADFLSEFISVLETEFDVVATATDGKSALEIIRSCSPDVVVLDIEMPGLNGIEVTKELSKTGPRPAVVICSVENDPQTIEAAREAGALGYVFKSRTRKDLAAAVKAVVRGQFFVSPA